LAAAKVVDYHLELLEATGDREEAAHLVALLGRADQALQDKALLAGKGPIVAALSVVVAAVLAQPGQVALQGGMVGLEHQIHFQGLLYFTAAAVAAVETLEFLAPEEMAAAAGAELMLQDRQLLALQTLAAAAAAALRAQFLRLREDLGL
jgi:hypothetical protein